MAKCLCQTADRLDPKRMRRSYRGRRRTAPSSRVAIYMNYYNEVRTHLSLGPRMLRLTCSSCRRSDSSEANSRWSPPRVRPDLICGRDRMNAEQTLAYTLGVTVRPIVGEKPECSTSPALGQLPPIAHSAADANSLLCFASPCCLRERLPLTWRSKT